MSNKSKGCLVIVAIILIGAASCAMCGGEEDLPDDLTAEETFVAETVGYETNHTEDEYKVRILDIQTTDDYMIFQLIGNDNLSTNMIKTGMLMDTQDIFEAAFDEYPDPPGIAVAWYFPMVDKLGNEELEVVLEIGLDRETAGSITWDNFDPDNFAAVADSYWEHIAFSD